jgi:integrase/recombinase XerD
MNLQLLIEQYIAYRRSLGEQQGANGGTLRQFGRFIGAGVEVADVHPDQVNAFLAGTGPITLTWHTKLSVLRPFYQYAISREYIAESPLPSVIPKRPPAFVPHIYSVEEMRRLLHAAKSDNRYRAGIRPETMHTILLVLYSSGLRIQELIDLDRADVNFTDSLMKVRQSKFGKTRLVPFGPQLHRALQDYSKQRPGDTGECPFFTTRYARRIKTDTLQHNYRIICEHAGVRRTDSARYQPRIHDLRHTFAVHRLTSWYRQGADVQKLLPFLSVYLGHVHIRATQVYLTMTPELLEEANNRFQQYAMKEVCHD